METDTDEKKERLDVLHQLTEEAKELDLKLSQLRQVAADREAIMNALHEYNDIKDATQAVIGHLANVRGVTVKEVHEKFNLPTADG